MNDARKGDSGACRRPRFQLVLFDLIFLLSWQAVAIGGIADYVGKLPTEMNWVRPSPHNFQRRDRFPLLVTAIVTISVTGFAAFFVARWLFRSAPQNLRRPAPRVAAAVVCLAVVFFVSLIHDFDYFKQQLLSGDWRYIMGGEWIDLGAAVRSRGVQVAAAAFCILLGIEFVALLRSGRIPAVAPREADPRSPPSAPRAPAP